MSHPNRTWTPYYTSIDGRTVPWTGPRDEDLAADGVSLVKRVTTDRWPFGPPSAHEPSCNLFGKGLSGGLYCDCLASDADDDEYGVAP